jgi:predicted transglutaminase-like cysteine proteinase
VRISSQLRAAARVLAVLGLVGPCASGAIARSVPELQLAALSLVEIAPQHVTPLPANGPFGLPVSIDSPLSARWHALQPAIRMELQVLALCRSNPGICPPSAARFLAVVDAARSRSGRARVGEVNRAVNLAIRPMSDLARFGIADVWATPLMTFAAGAGDCEDYAIAKYMALRQAGMADADLRLVIVHDRQVRQDHAVAAARVDGHWLILDNRQMMLLTDTQVRNVTPLLALNSGNKDRAPLIVAAPQRRPDAGLVAVASQN